MKLRHVDRALIASLLLLAIYIAFSIAVPPVTYEFRQVECPEVPPFGQHIPAMPQ